MEPPPSVASTSKPEVAIPIEIDPPVTGTNREPLVKKRTFPGIDMFALNAEDSGTIHDAGGRTVESVLQTEYHTSYVCRPQMDALLHQKQSSKQKEDCIRSMMLELDLAKELFSPERPIQLLNPNDAFCFPHQSRSIGTTEVPPPIEPKPPRPSKQMDVCYCEQASPVPKV